MEVKQRSWAAARQNPKRADGAAVGGGGGGQEKRAALAKEKRPLHFQQRRIL
jgi:hypothetical protein